MHVTYNIVLTLSFVASSPGSTQVFVVTCEKRESLVSLITCLTQTNIIINNDRGRRKPQGFDLDLSKSTKGIQMNVPLASFSLILAFLELLLS